MKRTLAAFICGALIAQFAFSTVLAQGGVVEPAEAPEALDGFTLSGSAQIVAGTAMGGGEYSLALRESSGIGAQADVDAFWRLGITGEATSPLADVHGRVFGPSATFRLQRGFPDLYHIFPASGISRTVQSAYYYLLDRAGSYSGEVEMTLEVLDTDGAPIRVVSAAGLDLQAAPLSSWTSVELAPHAENAGVFPGERLAFHVHLSDGAGGDLSVHPIYDVQLSSGSGPEPTPYADVAISKSVFPASVVPGETMTYTLVYTNNGPAVAGGVQIQDVVPFTLTQLSAVHSGAEITPTGELSYTWAVTDLARYTGGTITVTGRLDPALARTEFITNTAIISTTTYEQDHSNNRSSASFEAFVDPILSIRKAAIPDSAVPYHGVVTYTFELSNTGPVSATGAVVTDALPAHVEFARWITAPLDTTREGDEIRWSGTVSHGQMLTWTFAVTHTGDYKDVITNTARYAHASGRGSADAVFSVVGPELSVLKWVSPTQDAPYHGEVTYTLALSNGGAIDALGARLTDALPEEVQFARWLTYPQSFTPEPGDIDWTGAISAAETLTWTFVVTQAADYGATVTNTARYSQTYGSGSAEASFTTAEPDLSIEKTVVPDSLVAYHGEVTYTLALYNSGAADAPGTLLTDTVPSQVIFARWSEQNGAILSGTQLTWAGTVSASSAISVSFVATHTGDYGDVVPNGATFLHPGSGQAGSDVTSFSVVSAPALTGTKTVDPQYGVTRHGEITYTLTVSNVGEAVAAGALLTDAVPDGTAFARWVEQPAGAELVGNQVLWGGDVVGQGAVRIRFVATHTGAYGDVISNTFEYRYPALDQGGAASAQFRVESPPALQLNASVEPTYVRCKDVVTYSISLGNGGDELSLPTTLTDTLPDGVVFAHWAEQPGGSTATANEIRWNGTVSSHQSIAWGFAATHTGACDGVYTNTVHYLNSSASRESLAVFAVGAPQLEVTKQAEPESGVPLHGVVTYTLILSNTGEFDASSVVLTDVLPSAVTFGDWIEEPGGGTSREGDTLYWSGPALVDRGIIWRFTVTHTGDYGDVVTNTAQFASGDGTGSGSAVFAVLGTPEMHATKRAVPSAIQRGEEITYTIAISNSGGSPSVDSWMTDTLPARTAWVRWVEEPTRTVLGPGDVTWTGDLASGDTLTWTYVLSHTGETGDVLTNTVRCGNDVTNAEAAARVRVFGPIYLPVVLKRACGPAPDLTVVNIESGPNQVRVAIKNRGTTTIADDPANEFWVDLYVRPQPAPSHVNQPWATLADHGAAWGITWSGDPYTPVDPARQAFPLEPGEVFTLTTGGDYYWPSQSNLSWPLAAGTPLYAQVDSVWFGSWYGVIAEQDELCGLTYNNIAGPVSAGEGVPEELGTAVSVDATKDLRLTGLPGRRQDYEIIKSAG